MRAEKTYDGKFNSIEFLALKMGASFLPLFIRRRRSYAGKKILY
jgi:hypothetical protein